LIQTLWYLPSSDSRLTVSSEFGVAGNVAIESPNPVVSSAVATLPVQVPSADRLLLDLCDVRFSTNASSFLVVPSSNPAGLPPLWSPLPLIMPAARPPVPAPAGASK